MVSRLYYRVAEHVFALETPHAGKVAEQLTQYQPFRIDNPAADSLLFCLRVVPSADFPACEALEEDMRQEDEGSQIVAGHVGTQPYFEFRLMGERAARLLAGTDYTDGMVAVDGCGLYGINNALMVMFALASADKQTALFHSSVVSYEGRGYMFLGKSGTGKSTHSSLWLKYIEGTALVNDDNPVVRFVGDTARVYGSPWSGKTPCYRNVSYPIGAIVGLSQAPENKIRRLKGIEAYAVILSSVSGKRWDRQLADGLHQTEDRLAGEVPIWHLDCLPDEGAARLCSQTVAGRRKEMPVNDVMADVRQLVGEGRKVTLPVRGNSMLPFIVGDRDSVDLLAVKQPLRVGDVVLAWVEGCRYVVHRVFAMDGNQLTLMGDGNVRGVEHCTVADVLARAESVVTPDGIVHPLYTAAQQRKWKLWRMLLPLRRYLLFAYRLLYNK